MASYRKLYLETLKDCQNLRAERDDLNRRCEQYRQFIFQEQKIAYLKWTAERLGIDRKYIDELFDGAHPQSCHGNDGVLK